jgi:hypothetical protein
MASPAGMAMAVDKLAEAMANQRLFQNAVTKSE